MTTALKTDEIAVQMAKALPESQATAEGAAVVVSAASVLKVATFLKTTPGLDFDYLMNLTSVDYTDYFEVVYLLFSLEHNHSVTIKARVTGRENPALPSVTPVWRGADLQEREIFDLMGISFPGHPNLKRLFLWEGFPGYPLRRDYL